MYWEWKTEPLRCRRTDMEEQAGIMGSPAQAQTLVRDPPTRQVGQLQQVEEPRQGGPSSKNDQPGECQASLFSRGRTSELSRLLPEWQGTHTAWRQDLNFLRHFGGVAKAEKGGRDLILDLGSSPMNDLSAPRIHGS